MGSRLAIYHPQGLIEPGARPFGKDVANRDLFAALVHHGGFEQIDLLTHSVPVAAALGRDLVGERPTATRLNAGGILTQGLAARAGTLLRGKADLADLAWLRRRWVGDRAYSLVGLIHTLAPPAVRDYIAAASVAPVQPWDALICTSPSVQQAMDQMFEEWGGFLAERFGGTLRPKPRLPLVPLGVDLPAIAVAADDPAARAAVRTEFGLAEDDVLALWVGRLSYYEKAFPQPMFRAVAEAAAATGAKVQLVLAGWFPAGDKDRVQFEAAARAYAPDIPVHFVGGDDRARIGALWAGSDLFISLVDNIQETFGITPVEAMAARLPVVASDWDGYRYTVRHGVEGFLIPTLIPPPGRLGYAMATRHTLMMDSYQAYAGEVAQHTAVNVGKAVEALVALIGSPELRRRMGEAGRARVREMFDWPVVTAALRTVFDELDAVRAAAADPPASWPLHPVHGDPFRDFAGFATEVLKPGTRLSLRPGAGEADLDRAAGLTLDVYAAGWRATPEECRRMLGMIASGETATAGTVVARFPPDRTQQLLLGLVWMAKLGAIDWE